MKIDALWRSLRPEPRRREPSLRQLAGPFGTVTISGPPGDRYFETVALSGRAQRSFLTLLDMLPRRGTAVDAGANIGLMAVTLATAGFERVLACEPHPDVFGHLERTIALNGAAVTPINAALGKAPGEIGFFVDTGMAAASHVVTDATLARAGTTRVPVTTIDRIVAEHGIPRVDLLKVDVEGFEFDVLAGAAQTLARDRPPVFIEFNAFTLMAVANLNPREALAELVRMFPHVYRFADGKPYPIQSDADAIGYLHDVIAFSRGTDDLVCTYDPL